jgi:hypothetical protein
VHFDVRLHAGAAVNVADNRGQKIPLHGAPWAREGGNGFGGNRIDVHEDTAALLKKLMASR